LLGKFAYNFLGSHRVLFLGFINGRMKTTSYDTLSLEGIRDPQGGKNLSEALYRHLLETPIHNLLQKAKGYVVRLTETPVSYFS
jgi:hypothetical protein